MMEYRPLGKPPPVARSNSNMPVGMRGTGGMTLPRITTFSPLSFLIWAMMAADSPTGGLAAFSGAVAAVSEDAAVLLMLTAMDHPFTCLTASLIFSLTHSTAHE